MGEPRKLRISDINRVFGVSGKQYKKLTWHTTEMIIKTFLPMDEFLSLVDNVVQYCTDESGNIITDLIDFSIRINVIASYAFIELPDDICELYRIAYCTDIYEVIAACANTAQIKSIYYAIQIRAGIHDFN